MGQVGMTETGFEKDGELFVPWGANYFVPGTGWAPKLWATYDEDRARDDFAKMRDLGVNVVRVFATWMSFVESETRVNEEGFDKFDSMLRIAWENGILLHPTGPDHWEGQPAFMRGDANYIMSEHLLRAAENYWREMARRYKNDERIFAFDALNEPAVWPNERFWAEWGNLVEARGKGEGWLLSPEQFPARREWPPKGMAPEAILAIEQLRNRFGNAWLRRMVDAMHTGGNTTLTTCGFLQSTFPLRGSCGFHLTEPASLLDFISIHYYPGDITAAQDYRHDLDVGALWASYARSFGKPVVFGELGTVGGNTEPFTASWGSVYPPSTEEQGALWCRDLVEATRPYASGWLTWGTFDIPESLDCTRHSGLLDAGGRAKEWGRVFKGMALSIKASCPARDLPSVDFEAEPVVSGQVDRNRVMDDLVFRRRTQGEFFVREA